MESSGTPLEVLSHAATLVETENAGKYSDPKGKDLTVCGTKQKRTSEHDLSHTPPEKVRICNTTIPIHSESESKTKNPERIPVLSPAKFSRQNIEAHYSENSWNSDHTSDDDDKPLDMSKKCSSHRSEAQQQLRPSVITCAFRSQCHLKEQEQKPCDNKCDSSSEGEMVIVEKDKERPGHRREVLSGMCDPVIDEHFRRSLGKDYADIFSPNSSSGVSITVDDHFAKALGDTWHLLKTKISPESSGSQGGSKSSRSSPLVHHPQGVVS